jgi:hypothetical protein
MTRVGQTVLITTFIAFSWLAMQAVHECGHVLAAVATGGEIQKVVLHPLALSRTDVTPNPHPLLVVWAGPVFGSVVPLGAWALAKFLGWSHIFLWRFFAGFCLVSNGVYLVGGSFARGADPGDLMRLGMSQAVLISVGLVGAVSGFWLWHRQGHHFGLGDSGGEVKTGAVIASVILLAVVATGEFICGSK